jgi:hypothetical protein
LERLANTSLNKFLKKLILAKLIEVYSIPQGPVIAEVEDALRVRELGPIELGEAPYIISRKQTTVQCCPFLAAT